MPRPANPRAAAARALQAVIENGRSLDAALGPAMEGCRENDRALASEMAYGAVRQHLALRALLERVLERPLPRRDRIVEALIEVGLYQLWQLRVPDHAAVSETVSACVELGRARHRGLVNAVLRRFQREREALLDTVLRDREAALAHPGWLLDRLAADWPDHWTEIVAANNERAPMWLRVNLDRADPDVWCSGLPDDVKGTALPGVPCALRLSRPLPVAELPGFAEGLISVQDGAAQIAALLLEARPGMRILDACAAPGGKTTHILETVSGEAMLTAVDNDAERLAMVASGIGRAGYKATLVHGDASMPDPWWDGIAFDRILLDAPCSATGVIRRHPDIKFLRRAADVERMAAQQLRMLRALWPLLAPGGRLVYATCSVLKAENSAVFGRFSKEQASAVVSKTLPNDNIRDLMGAEDTGYQLFPGAFALDGFFYGCIEKPT